MHELGSKRAFLARTTFSIIALLILSAVTLFIYRPGLWGPFLFDDYPNIVFNNAIHLNALNTDALSNALFTSDSGPLNRPISMLSFALNYYYTGLNQYYFKLTNLLIHLVNGLGVFVLVSLLLKHYRREFQPALTRTHATWIGLAVTAAWLLQPMNLTGVLFIVQRMTSLSALFCIYGLALFVQGRMRLIENKGGWPTILASVVVFTPLAALSKETGALLPLFMLVTEITLFNFRARDSIARRRLVAFYALTVGVPALLATAFLITHPAWLLDGFLRRDFTLAQRVMTEPRVMWFYIQQILLPRTSAMGLFHDDMAISRSLTQPSTTLPALLGIVLLPIVAIGLRKRAPMLAFGILFFLAGHVLESTIVALELVYEHRNYLPMFGIELTVFYYLLHPSMPRTLALRAIVAMLLIAVFAADTMTRAKQWSNPFDFFSGEAAHHPDSPRANDELGNILANIKTTNATAAQQNVQAASYYFASATTLDDNYVNGLFGLIELHANRQLPVDPSWVTELTSRLRHAPFASDIDNLIQELITCQVNGICKLSQAQIDGLFEAALHNPTCVDQSRAAVYLAKAVYLINVDKNYKDGLAAMQDMVTSAPWVLQNRLSLAKYLVAIRDFKAAREQLDVIAHMDNWQAYQQDILQIRRKISDTEKASGTLTAH